MLTAYSLSLCVLIAEYAQQQQRPNQQQQQSQREDGQEDALELTLQLHPQTNYKLLRFLSHELQTPPPPSTTRSPDSDSACSLAQLLARCKQFVTKESEWKALSHLMLSRLQAVDSPDATQELVDYIAQSVAGSSNTVVNGPNGSSGPSGPNSVTTNAGTGGGGGGGSGGSGLVDSGGGPSALPSESAAMDFMAPAVQRSSILGIFVRQFLVEFNQLLFDGIVALYDLIQLYLEEFEDDTVGRALFRYPQSHQRHVRKFKDGGPDTDLFPSPILTSSKAAGSKTNGKSNGSGQSSSPISTNRLSSVGTENSMRHVGSQLSHLQHQFLHDDIISRFNRVSSDVGQSYGSCEPQPRRGSQRPRQHQSRLESDPPSLFVQLLSHVEAHDYANALDALHRYHDYAIANAKRSTASLRRRKKQQEVPPQPPNTGVKTTTPNSSLHVGAVQYAALNLAALEMTFGHHELACESLQECLRVAQHHGDSVCVAFALLWLVQVYQKLGKSRASVVLLLHDCIDRGNELRVVSLSVFASLIQIQQELTWSKASQVGGRPLAMASGETNNDLFWLWHYNHQPSPKPFVLWEKMYQVTRSLLSSHVGAAATRETGGPRHQMGAWMRGGATAVNGTMALHRNNNGPVGTTMHRHRKSTEWWINSMDSLLQKKWQLESKQTLSLCVGWHLFGNATLSEFFASSFLQCHSLSGNVADVAIALCHCCLVRLHPLQQEEHDKDKTVGDVNAFHQAIQLALDKSLAFPSTCADRIWSQKPLQQLVCKLFFLWALYQRKTSLASMFLDHLQALAWSDGTASKLDAQLAFALFLKETERIEDAQQLLLQLRKRFEDQEVCSEADPTAGDRLMQIQVLILSAQVALDSTRAKSISNGTRFALDAMQKAQESHFDSYFVEAQNVLIDIFLQMGQLDKAQQLLDDEMPHVMQHGTLLLAAESLLLYAKLCIAKGHEQFEQALGYLAKSQLWFARVGHLHRLMEIASLKALVYDSLSTGPSNEQSKQAEAREFLRLQQRKRFNASQELGENDSWSGWSSQTVAKWLKRLADPNS